MPCHFVITITGQLVGQCICEDDCVTQLVLAVGVLAFIFFVTAHTICIDNTLCLQTVHTQQWCQTHWRNSLQSTCADDARHVYIGRYTDGQLPASAL